MTESSRLQSYVFQCSKRCLHAYESCESTINVGRGTSMKLHQATSASVGTNPRVCHAPVNLNERIELLRTGTCPGTCNERSKVSQPIIVFSERREFARERLEVSYRYIGSRMESKARHANSTLNQQMVFVHACIDNVPVRTGADRIPDDSLGTVRTRLWRVNVSPFPPLKKTSFRRMD